MKGLLYPPSFLLLQGTDLRPDLGLLGIDLQGFLERGQGFLDSSEPDIIFSDLIEQDGVDSEPGDGPVQNVDGLGPFA
jgi:hypothetical protein